MALNTSMNNYFQAVCTSCNFIEHIEKFVSSAEWKWEPSMFVATNLPNVSQDDVFLKQVSAQFSGSLQLYKIPSNSVYTWHRDKDTIGCSINMVLDNYNCHTLFSIGNHGTPVLQKVIELKYTPKIWYAFNSKELHTVINVDTRDRYLLSFILPGNVRYADLTKWLADQNYISK
jgi:hypothetical protein